MERDPLISVIVPVYKVEAYLAECVASIRDQTYRNLEIILVDDGSPDSSGTMCDAFAREDPRIKVIHKPNGGLSDARNVGIDDARGEYLGFVDSDDRVDPDMYRSMMDYARKMDVPMVCVGRYDMYENARLEPGLCPPREEVVCGEELTRRILTWENIDTAAWDKLYRADLFDGIRYPKGYVAEDVPVTYRLALRAGRIGLLPRNLYHYRHREGSITTSRMSDNRLHVLRHTELLLQDIGENYPEMMKYARYFRLRQVSNLLQTLDLSDRATRERYAPLYRDLKRELLRERKDILKSDLFSLRGKVEIGMMLLGIYRGCRRIYHKLAGRA